MNVNSGPLSLGCYTSKSLWTPTDSGKFQTYLIFLFDEGYVESTYVGYEFIVFIEENFLLSGRTINGWVVY